MTRRVAPVLAVLLAAGCGGEPTAELSGTVTHNGKPLPGVTVTVFPTNNRTFTADTGPDGTYRVAVTGRGTARLSVQAPPPRPAARPDPPPAKANSAGGKAAATDDQAKMSRMPPPSDIPPAVQLPPQYADPATSGLAVELTGQPVRYDIPLK